MEADTVLAEVRAIDTRRGSVRYVSTDAEGNEYTTFREDIGERAKQLQGECVRLEYHKERRGQYTNVYLDSIEPAAQPVTGETTTDPEQAAWRTAVAAAPWLVGEPASVVPPKTLYDKLKPFEERIADDAEKPQRGRARDDDRD